MRPWRQRFTAISSAKAVLDGEIVVLDADGRPRFYDLLRRRGNRFHVFDLLRLYGRDLRFRPLIERKRILRSILSNSHRFLFADHVEERDIDFFRLACECGLETYGESWFKIRNPVHSQYEGGRELFKRSILVRQ